jgi:putative colanic acid biosynthesis acetyltransferase WcaF
MERILVDISTAKNYLGFRNKLARFIWGFTWCVFARPIPRQLFNSWKIALLRLFGARVHKSAVVYSSAKIFMPWNLEMDEYSILGSEVNCYNVDKIKIGANTVVSQMTFLCSASHDFLKSDMPLIAAPIIIGDQVWIAADVFIGMGVTIGQGAVVGARASVFKNVEPWTVVGGNPAKFIKKREMRMH